MGKEKKLEVTDRIERFEVLEDRFGVSFESIFAMYKDDGDGFRNVVVNYDIISRSSQCNQDMQVTVAVYNDRHQLVETSNHLVFAAKFMGIQACSHSINFLRKAPALIRLYPQAM